MKYKLTLSDIVDDIFSMEGLLKIFGDYKLDDKNKFEFNGKTYKIQFEYKDGVAALTGDKQLKQKDVKDIGVQVESQVMPPARLIMTQSSSLQRPGTFISKPDSLAVIDSDEEEDLELSLNRQTYYSLGRVSEQEKLEKNKLHFAFLFASPLVIKYQSESSSSENREGTPIMKIDFNREFNEISKALSQCHTLVNYSKECALFKELPSLLLKNPKVLHFSGHGVKNNFETLGNEAKMFSGKGDFLVLENYKGYAEFVDRETLQRLLSKYKTDIELVFVSSCHSELIGQIFFEAGIKHVICIKESETISDEASIVFAKAFYQALFTKNQKTICEAYEAAKETVNFHSGVDSCQKGEHFKYILHTKCQGKCTIISESMLSGRAKNKSEKPAFGLLPNRVEHLIGRDNECQKIVESINENRLLSISGIQGIGKSAVLKEVCHYIHQRSLIKDGVIYLSLARCQSIEGFSKILILAIDSQTSRNNWYRRMPTQEKLNENNMRSLLDSIKNK